MSWLYPDTDKYDDYIDKGRFVMLWRITIFFIFAFFSLAIATWFYDRVSTVIYAGIWVIAIFCLIYLKYSRDLKPICYIYSIAGTAILSVSCNLYTGLIHTPDFFWAFAVIIFTFTTLNSRLGWFVIGCFGVIVGVHFCFFFETIYMKLDAHTNVEMIGITAEILIALTVSGYFMSQHIIFMRYTEAQMSLANAELELQNQIIQRKSDENAILVKEIHHRVKNNLQIIISLLRMHRDEVGSNEAKKDFDEAINRILSMALLHQQMYREKELSRFSLEEYIHSLSTDIINSYKQENQTILCKLNVRDFQLKLESIVPLGLMINELISNSLKHAFDRSSEGEIDIVLKEIENGFYLKYSDDGTWIDDELLVQGFGLDLVHLLSEQLNGTLKRTGSTFELTVQNT